MADSSITKTELVAAIASQRGLSQSTVGEILDAMFGAVAHAVAAGSTVTIPGWISFTQVATAARTGRNPQTGEEIRIPAGRRVKVTAGRRLKQAVTQSGLGGPTAPVSHWWAADPSPSLPQPTPEKNTLTGSATMTRPEAGVPKLAAELWAPAIVEKWMFGSNSFLGGARPIDVLAIHGPETVVEALQQEIAGAFA